MKNNSFTARLHSLKTRWLPLIFSLCVLAAALGMVGAGGLLSARFREYLLWDMMAGGINSPEAAKTYVMLQMVLMVAGPVFAAMMAVCLGISLFGRPASGFYLLSTLAEWLVRGLNVAGLVLTAAFAWKFLRYAWGCLRVDSGFYLLFSMILWEGLMLILAAVLFFTLRRFLNSLCDSAVGLAYNLAAHKTDAAALSGFTATGFGLLGIACLLMAADQAFTLTIVPDAYEPYYKLLLSPQPAQWASIAGFVLCAVGDGLLFLAFRRYQGLCERISCRGMLK